MLKKYLCLCSAFIMAFTLLLPAQAHAQGKVGSITPSTVITKDNIQDVLKYVGIDPSSFELTADVKNGIYTVGELEKTLKEVEKMKANEKNVKDTVVSEFTGEGGTSNAPTLSTGYTGSKMLYRTMDHGGSYTVTYSILGYFSVIDGDRNWTGNGASNAEADSDVVGMTYKVTYKSLTGYWNRDYITLSSHITVTWYIGVGNVGLVKVGSNNIDAVNRWGTSYIP